MAIIMALITGISSSQIEMNYSYETKYGDGKEVNKASPNTLNPTKNDYGYFENIMEINTTFSNGIYLFTQLEYSKPPVLGENIQGLGRFYLDYYHDELYLKVGDIYSLQGRGLSLNLIQDQTIDYDNSVRGLETRYNLYDHFALYAIIGQSEYWYRSETTKREKNRSLDTQLGFVGFEYEHDLIGSISSSLLLNDIFSDNEDNLTNYRLTEYDFIWNRQINNVDLYFEHVISTTNEPEDNEGRKFYAVMYTDIVDFGITYEYKDYLLDYDHNIISANAPIVFRESNSTLISSNAHAINWNDEIGHQIEINKSFSDRLSIQSNLSISYNHSSNNLNFSDILKMDSESEIYSKYPFRQFYLEASGWILDGDLYYKIGVDQFEDFKKTFGEPSSLSAFSIPSMFTFNISEQNSVAIYAEYQNRDEVKRSLDMSINTINNFIDHYFSFTYNYHNLLSLTYFYRDEKFHGTFGASFGGGDQPNSGNVDQWKGFDITYKINSSTQISIFSGSQKGGLVCANGICAVQPGFDDGYKVTFRSLF